MLNRCDYKIFFFFAVLWIIHGQEQRKVLIEVYYESLCPASVHFITQRLYPVYKTIGKEYLNIQLVPYGSTKLRHGENGTYISCPHGEKECYANLFHACAMELYDWWKALEFANCQLNSTQYTVEIMKECCSKSTISWPQLQKCMSTDQATHVIVKCGQKTHAVEPDIEYLPAIVFEDIYILDWSEAGRKDLLNEVCALLWNEHANCTNATSTFADL